MATDTRENIKQKFIELLETSALNKIGVKEITEACGVNRNTFYYYYKNIPDLIESVVKETVDALVAQYPPSYDTLEECFAAAMDFAKNQRQMIYNIYNSTNRAVFERYLWKICSYAIDTYLSTLPPLPPGATPPNPEELGAIRDILKFEMFGFVMDWINHGMPEDSKDKIRILSNYLQDKIIF